MEKNWQSIKSLADQCEIKPSDVIACATVFDTILGGEHVRREGGLDYIHPEIEALLKNNHELKHFIQWPQRKVKEFDKHTETKRRATQASGWVRFNELQEEYGLRTPTAITKRCDAAERILNDPEAPEKDVIFSFGHYIAPELVSCFDFGSKQERGDVAMSHTKDAIQNNKEKLRVALRKRYQPLQEALNTVSQIKVTPPTIRNATIERIKQSEHWQQKVSKPVAPDFGFWESLKTTSEKSNISTTGLSLRLGSLHRIINAYAQKNGKPNIKGFVKNGSFPSILEPLITVEGNANYEKNAKWNNITKFIKQNPEELYAALKENHPELIGTENKSIPL